MSNRNAAASLFGWDFQVNAAILLMLENIKGAEKVTVEGKYDDIEIFLNDGSKIYSQAKAVERPDDSSNVLKKLNSALRTLNNDARNNDGSQYTYITNSQNPFNSQKSKMYFNRRTHLWFDELSRETRDKIEGIIKEKGYDNLPINKLDIHVIPFYGRDLKNRYKEIQAAVNEFLVSIDSSLGDISAKILEIWQKDFFQNATLTDTEISIGKGEMIWPLIVLVIDRTIANDYKKDFSDDEIYEIENKYRRIINNKVVQYNFFTKVISDFKESGLSLKAFTESNWGNYSNEIIEINADSNTKEVLLKIIVYRILTQRRCISDIKKGANL